MTSSGMIEPVKQGCWRQHLLEFYLVQWNRLCRATTPIQRNSESNNATFMLDYTSSQDAGSVRKTLQLRPRNWPARRRWRIQRVGKPPPIPRAIVVRHNGSDRSQVSKSKELALSGSATPDWADMVEEIVPKDGEHKTTSVRKSLMNFLPQRWINMADENFQDNSFPSLKANRR